MNQNAAGHFHLPATLRVGALLFGVIAVTAALLPLFQAAALIA